MATKFQLAVEAVLKGHGLLEKFQTQTEFHLRLEGKLLHTLRDVGPHALSRGLASEVRFLR